MILPQLKLLGKQCMTILSTGGKMANELARSIFRHQRTIVDGLVKAGEISAKQADKEFARRSAKELGRHGLKVPKWIANMLK